MKKKMTTLLALCLPFMAFAGEEPRGLLDSIEVRTFGLIETSDFDQRERDGVGAGLAYFPFQNWGVEFEGVAYDNDNQAVDRGNLNMLFRAPIGEDFAFVPFGGGTRDFNLDEWGYHVGIRAEARVYKGLWGSAGIRWQKQTTQDWATITAGLGWKF